MAQSIPFLPFRVRIHHYRAVYVFIICLVPFWFPNIDTKPSIIFIIPFIIIITTANICCHVQYVRHCKKSFMWIIPIPVLRVKTKSAKEYGFWNLNTWSHYRHMLIPSLAFWAQSLNFSMHTFPHQENWNNNSHLPSLQWGLNMRIALGPVNNGAQDRWTEVLFIYKL